MTTPSTGGPRDDEPAPGDLTVLLYGTHLGVLRRTPQGRATFTASTQALARYGVGARPLSMALPLQTRPVPPEATEAFFGGLLPEGARRDVLARAAGCSRDDVIGLLRFVGADVAGAVVLPGPDVTALGPAMTVAQVARELADPSGYVGGGGSGGVAGVRPKIGLARADGRWHAAVDGHASTHILKPVAPDRAHLAHSEAWLMTIARSIGLTSHAVTVESIGGLPTVVVERFDRTIEGDRVHRVHQEDMAQALGLPWGGDAKYEAIDARASLRAIAALLDRGRSLFAVGEPDRERMLRYVTFNVLVGNTDAHAKNYSLVHAAHGHAHLAPLYDVTAPPLEYEGSLTLALKVGGIAYQPDVTAEALVTEARSWGLGTDRAREVVVRTAQDVLTSVTAAVGAREPKIDASISDTLPGYVATQAQNLLEGRRVSIGARVPLALLRRIPVPG